VCGTVARACSGAVVVAIRTCTSALQAAAVCHYAHTVDCSALIAQLPICSSILHCKHLFGQPDITTNLTLQQ
jgi:hypothetical protein